MLILFNKIRMSRRRASCYSVLLRVFELELEHGHGLELGIELRRDLGLEHGFELGHELEHGQGREGAKISKHGLGVGFKGFMLVLWLM